MPGAIENVRVESNYQIIIVFIQKHPINRYYDLNLLSTHLPPTNGTSRALTCDIGKVNINPRRASAVNKTIGSKARQDN
jgi:hypothetical protein